MRIKELIIDSQLDYNTVLYLEQFLLNYVGWNIDLVSVSEIVYSIAYLLEIAEEDWEEIHECIEDFINYVLSESEIYTSFDQFTIALTVMKLVFEKKGWDLGLKKLAELVQKINLDSEDVKNCQILIKCQFESNQNGEEEDDVYLSTNISADDLCFSSL